MFSASTMTAAPKGAMVTASGNVVINGTAIARSSAVFVGDHIQTAARGAAALSTSGTSIIVPANSAIIYEGQSVELSGGSVEINTTKGVTARASFLTIAPASKGNAKFEVTRTGGSIVIAALRNSVLVSDGAQSTVVAQGSSETRTEEQEAPDPNAKKKKKKRGAVAIPVARGGVGVSTALLIVGAAGAATAIAVTSSKNPEPESRSGLSNR